ncbi:hypothetical protein CB1_001914001 [Camelus ferus]|nr:hypothetical protein CB1_001914001 [Camelus ferus]
MLNVNNIETESQETGRWRNFNSWIKRNFNYECYLNFLTGCYSCKLEAEQRKSRRPLCCCSLVQRDGEELDHSFLDMGNMDNERSVLIVYAPYLHLSSISVMVLLSWPVAFYLIHLEGEALQVAVGLPFFLILLCLYVMPFGNYSPCIQEKDKLGPKPSFFGHRGAPMVGLSMMDVVRVVVHGDIASDEQIPNQIGDVDRQDSGLRARCPCLPQLGPENTMMSFEKAVEHGAFGLESDVHISYDHVPFLMHDLSLRRTTNIKEVLPNASLRHPSLFDWDFLATLNAGKWFSHSQIKPFYHMKPLSEADKEKAGNQKIPKLTDLLELAQKEKKLVIFDLNSPVPKHPARKEFVRLVVNVILASGIEQHLIVWLPGFDRKYVRSTAPGFQHVGRLFTIERLTKENISRINVDYKRLFYNGLRFN